jgi:hypothetical protein
VAASSAGHIKNENKVGMKNVLLSYPVSHIEADIQSEDNSCNEKGIIVATFYSAAICMVCVRFLVSVLSFVDF